MANIENMSKEVKELEAQMSKTKNNVEKSVIGSKINSLKKAITDANFKTSLEKDKKIEVKKEVGPANNTSEEYRKNNDNYNNNKHQNNNKHNNPNNVPVPNTTGSTQVSI